MVWAVTLVLTVRAAQLQVAAARAAGNLVQLDRQEVALPDKVPLVETIQRRLAEEEEAEQL